MVEYIGTSMLLDLSCKLEQLIDLQTANLEVNRQILQESLDKRDEGKSIHSIGTVVSTAFTIMDTALVPGHRVKGFQIVNNGPSDLYYLHTTDQSPQMDVDLVDIANFEILKANREIKFKWDQNVVKSLVMATLPVTSTVYESWLVW